MNEQKKETLPPKAGDIVAVPVHWAGKTLTGIVMSSEKDGFWLASDDDLFFIEAGAEYELADEEGGDVFSEVEKIVERTWNTHLSEKDRQHHAIYTLLTEAAEVADCVKKGWYSPRHNGVLDKQHMAEEIGDVLYGVVAVCLEFGIDPCHSVDILREKLAKRYA